MRTWLVAIGLFSMLGQVVLLRELSVAFYGSELIYVLALGVWMVFTGAGAGASWWSPSPARVRALLLAVSLTTPAAVALTRALRPLGSDVPGAYLSFPLQLFAMACLLAPVSVLLGLSFQWAARLYALTGRTVAGAYAIESAGGLAGGALATLLMLAGVPNLVIGLAGALAMCAVALHPWRGRPRWLVFVAPPSTVLLAAALIAAPALDTRLTALTHPDLRATRDTAYGRIAVCASGDQVTVFENDALVFDTHSTSAEELTHVAAVQRAGSPDRVLILGGGVEGSVAAALAHHPEQLDVVELNGALLELARAHMPSDALDNEAVHITIADPRAFLRTPGPPYDLILVGAPEPTSGLSNRYYTREMFALVRSRLTADGILAFRLPAGDNFLGAHHRRRLASIHRALRAELSDAVILPGTAHLIIASNARLDRDPGLLARRFDAREIEARLVSGPYLHYLYENDRFATLAAAVAETDVPENRDARPVCYRHTLMIWLSRFYPAVALMELDPARVPTLGWIALALVLASALAVVRRWPRGRVATRVAIAGFVGMVLETAIVLAYQSSRGALFGDLGVLLTAFMAGLTIASLAIARLKAVPHWLGPVLTLGLTVNGALVASLVGSADLGLVLACLLLGSSGAAVAGVFAHATRMAHSQEAAVAPLYAADLAGGALASVLASLILIPWIGLWGASLLAAALGLGATALTGK